MIETCLLDGVLLITPKRISDDRGHFVETYNPRLAESAGLPVFVQDNESYSKDVGVVRGLHFQLPPFPQAKLVRCVRGAIYDVVVDLRSESATYGKHVGFELDEHNGQLVYVPAGFAHGFCTTSPDTLVSYKVDTVYSADHDSGVQWNSPELEISWPVDAAAAILSSKDQQATGFGEFKTPF